MNLEIHPTLEDYAAARLLHPSIHEALNETLWSLTEEAEALFPEIEIAPRLMVGDWSGEVYVNLRISIPWVDHEAFMNPNSIPSPTTIETEILDHRPLETIRVRVFLQTPLEEEDTDFLRSLGRVRTTVGAFYETLSCGI